jgi:flagellin
MASFINTNMASLNTQRNLSASQAALNTSIQRLSSGMRVNSAKDDAAGMAIASRMDSNIRGNTVAMRNANDAISFSQTAEGALSKIGDNLQRMRELAVQSANGSNGAEDRTSLDTEFKQLQAEITRVTGNTKFNGVQVLGAASAAGVTFQIGDANNNEDKIQMQGADLTNAGSATSIAANQSQSNAAYTNAKAALIAAGGTVSGPGVGADKATPDATSTAALNAFNAVKAQMGLKAADTVDDSSGINILDQTNAGNALTAIDNALKEVNTESIKHGANQNRFAAVISTLQVSVENQTAARSRIMDTDFASETATMARGQILQQAGMAMLAQANQLPNGVMALLR